MKNAFLIFLSVFMSGCAVIDSACLETADIVEPGRVSLGLEMSIGPDLESAAQLADESFDDDRVVGGWIVPAFKLGFGIDESSDFNIKMWATYNGTGGRIYYKSILNSKKSGQKAAIATGINFIRSPSKEINGNPSPNIRTYGFEIPYIRTLRMEKRLRLNWIIRYGFDHISIEDVTPVYPDDELSSTDLHRFAAIGGISFHPIKKSGAFQFNIGVEVLTPLNGSFGFTPLIGIGLRL